MMKNRKVYSRLSILIVIILLLAGTQVLAVTLNRVTNVKAKPTANAVTVTWNKVTNAKEYEVSIWIPGIGYVPQPRVKTTSKYISGLTSGDTYKVKVRAISGSSSGQYSSEVTFRTSGSSSGGSTSKTKPARVTGLRTTNVTNDAVSLVWNRVTGATGYKVYVYIPGIGYTYVRNVTGTSATVSGFTSVTGNENGLNYRAKIIAFNNAGDGPESAEINFRTPRSSTGGSSSKTKPARVTGLRTTNVTNDAVSLVWNRVTGATGYKVYVYIPGIGYTYVRNVTGTSATVSGFTSVTGNENGLNYRAKIIAFNNAGDGPESAEVNFRTPRSSSAGGSSGSKLSKVTNLRMRTNGADTVVIDFNKVSGATNYEIFFRTASTSYKSLGYISSTAGGLKLTGLNPGTTYYLKIRAIDSSRKPGPDSEEFRFVTNRASSSAKPGQVTGLRTTSITNDAVSLAWNSVSGATGYKVYVYIPGIGYTYVRNVTGTSATVSGFTSVTGNEAGLEYKAKIIAFNSVGDGPESAEIKFKTPKSSTTSKIAQVTGVKVVPSTNKATVTWDAVAGATAYEIALNGNVIGRVSGNSTGLKGLVAGTTYRIKIRAYIGTNPGEYSSEVTFKTTAAAVTTPKQPEKPAKVTGFKVTSVKENEVEFSFNKLNGATGYKIYILREGSSDGRIITTTTTSAKYSLLTPGTKYEAMILAYKTENGQTVEGDFSEIVRFKTTEQVKVGKGSKVTVTNITTKGATFTYNSVSNATGYSLSIRKQGESKANLSMSVKNTSTSTVMLNPGTTYYVKVRGYTVQNGKVVYGEYSEETKFTTAQDFQVRNLKVDSISTTSVKLSWDNITGASYYMIWAREEGKVNMSIVGGTRNAPTSVTLTPGKTYYLQVFAQYKDGSVLKYGLGSNIVKVTMPIK